MKAPRREDPEIGLVKTCTKCGEEWPDDEEFYPKGGHGSRSAWCRACWSEHKRVAA